jgi:hypothetical protein
MGMFHSYVSIPEGKIFGDVDGGHLNVN